MTARLRGEAGQAFPIYVVMVAGLLFLAFAFFTVGRASALRNGAQGAADAAALAAAQQAREDMEAPFLASLPERMLDVFLNSYQFSAAMPCASAQRLASANEADVEECEPQYGGRRDKITVEVKTRKPVGSPVIRGMDREYAKSRATAIVEFRCDWHSVDLNDDSIEDVYYFTCGSAGAVEIRTSSPPSWSSVSKILFDVHLVDS